MATTTTALKRQLRDLRQARARWRQRAAAKQQAIRKLRVSLRDLAASRQRWKQRYRQLRRQSAAQDAPAPPALLPHPSCQAGPPLGER